MSWVNIGMGLAVVGFVLTIVEIGFDVRSIGDLNFGLLLAGGAIAVSSARRRRRQQARLWAPPVQADRFEQRP